MKQKRQFYFFVAVLLPVLFVLNGLLFYSTKCNGEYVQSKNTWGVSESVKVGDFVRKQQIIDNLPEEPEAALAAVDEIINYLLVSEKQRNDVYIKYLEMLSGEKLSEDLVAPEENRLIPEEIVRMGINASDIEKYEQVQKLVSDVVQYEAYVKGVAENAGMIADSLYSIYDDSWLLKNLAQCQKDYYGLEYVRPEVAQDNIFNMVINYHVTDILAFMFALAVAVAFCYYIKGDSFGESHDTRRTTIGMLVLMEIGLIGFYVMNFVIAETVYGLPPLSAPLQSLEEYYVCPYDISVGGFVVIWITFKVLTQLLLLGICILAFTGRHRVLTCGLAAAFLAFEYWRHFDVPDKNAAGVFGEINLFSGFTAERFYNRYLNLNLADVMLPRFPVFLGVLLAALLAAIVLVYKKFGQWHKVARQETMNSYFGEIDKRYQETRLLWHDFNNHLLAIKALYENGRQEQAAQYIDDLSEQSYARLLPAKSGSDTVDLLLFKKHQQAAEFGVKIRFKIDCSLSGLSVTDYDLCSLFGNLLDNAVEAARKVEQAEPTVVLHVNRQNSMLLISCENPYTGELVKQDGELKTTKKDTAKHGIGLASVKHICKKYNGNLELETENQTFRISVLLNV